MSVIIFPSSEHVLNLYKHVAPLASLELGLIFKEKAMDMVTEEAVGNNNNQEKVVRKRNSMKVNEDEIEQLFKVSESYLTRATNNYTHYLNETVIHMRSYNAITVIEEIKKKRNKRSKDKLLNRESSSGSIVSLLLI